MSDPRQVVDDLVDSLTKMHIDEEKPSLSLNTRLSLEALDRTFGGEVALIGLALANRRLREMKP